MSETDRELLELAAKSAGLERTHYRDGCFCYTTRLGTSVKWNPLTDYGDAFRLAVGVKLCCGPNMTGDCAVAFNYSNNVVEPYGNDPYAATRRAIVRAAAEIGKAMNGE